MKYVSRSALMPYTAEQMFDVVNDVARYQEFLPWCAASDVLSQTSDVLSQTGDVLSQTKEVLSQTQEEMTARLTIAKGGMSQQFTTRNVYSRPDSIQLHLVDGPFSALEGQWVFRALGSDGCKIEMTLRFEMNSRLLGAMLGKVFEQAADTLVDAFCQRAEQIYG